MTSEAIDDHIADYIKGSIIQTLAMMGEDDKLGEVEQLDLNEVVWLVRNDLELKYGADNLQQLAAILSNPLLKSYSYSLDEAVVLQFHKLAPLVDLLAYKG